MKLELHSSANTRLRIKSIQSKDQALGNYYITEREIDEMQPFFGNKRPFHLGRIDLATGPGDYNIVEPFSFEDVDGQVYNTVLTTRFRSDGDAPKPSIGLNQYSAPDLLTQHPEFDESADWDTKATWREQVVDSYLSKGLNPHAIITRDKLRRMKYGSGYFGTNSRYIKRQLPLSPELIIDILRSGWSVSPGDHTRKQDEFGNYGSYRSDESLNHTQFVLLDADDWDYRNGKSLDTERLFAEYPILNNIVYAVLESVSSQSNLKPEYRYRLMVVFPEQVSDRDFFTSLTDILHEHLPMIDPRVAKDITRLSFGNGRDDSFVKILGNTLPQPYMEEAYSRSEGIKQQRIEEEQRIEYLEHQNQQRQERRVEQINIAKRRGLINESVDHRIPYIAFQQDNAGRIRTLILDPALGLESLDGDHYHSIHSESGGVSCQLYESNAMLHLFSSSMIRTTTPPKWKDKYKGTGRRHCIFFWRYYFWCKYGLDIAVKSDRDKLNIILESEGYGTTINPEQILHSEINAQSDPVETGSDTESPIIEYQDDRDFTVGPETHGQDSQQRKVVKRKYHRDLDELSFEEQKVVTEVVGAPPNIKHVLDEDGNLTPPFSMKYPKRRGVPDQTRNRIWVTCKRDACSKCGDAVISYVDMYPPIAYDWCPTCQQSEYIGSYATLHWNKKAYNALASTFAGFVSDDPIMLEVRPWRPNHILHVAAPMGTGKTTWAHQVMVETKENDQNLIPIIVSPRGTLTEMLYKSFTNIANPPVENENEEDDDDEDEEIPTEWGLWSEGSGELKIIGDIGCVCTTISLKFLLKRLYDEGVTPDRIRLIFDEWDFHLDLLSSDISEDEVVEIKDYLREIAKTSGIVTMGQTVFLAVLEKSAIEFGIEPTHISYYDKPAIEKAADVIIHQTPSLVYKDGMLVEYKEKSLNLLYVLLNGIWGTLDRKKRAYVFCRQRMLAKELEIYIENYLKENFKVESGTTVFTKFDKGGNDRNHVLEEGILRKDKRALISNKTIDVGVSIHDENAEVHVIVDGNPALLGGPQTTIQQGHRVRNPLVINIYYTHVNQTAPSVPTEQYEFDMFYESRKRTVMGMSDDELDKLRNQVAHLSIADSLMKLSAYELERYIKFQLERSGFNVETSGGRLGNTSPKLTLDTFRKNRKIRKENEKYRIQEKLFEYFNVNPDDNRDAELMHPTDIRAASRAGSLSLDGIDANSYERAYQYCKLVGYVILTSFMKDQISKSYGDYDEEAYSIEDSEIPVMTEQQRGLCLQMTNEYVDPATMHKLQRGYAAVHYPYCSFENRQYPEIEATVIANESDKGMLLTKILQETPTFGSYDEFDKVINKVLKSKIQDRRSRPTTTVSVLSLLQRGALKSQIAKQLKFVNLSKPNRYVTEVILAYVQEHYPVKFKHNKKAKRIIKGPSDILNIVHDSVNIRLRTDDRDKPFTMQEEGLVPITIEEMTTEVRIAKAMRDGMSVQDVMRQEDVSQSYVYRIRNKYGVFSKPLTELIVDEFKTAARFSVKDIINRLNKPAKNIRKAVYNLEKKGQIKKVARGVYRIV